VFDVKMTKAASLKRLKEAKGKVFAVLVAGHITIDQANKILAPLERLIKSMK
jgi:hypothetical protein